MFFEATDSDSNMREVFGIYTIMTEEMQRREFEFDKGEEFGKNYLFLEIMNGCAIIITSYGRKFIVSMSVVQGAVIADFQWATTLTLFRHLSTLC